MIRARLPNGDLATYIGPSGTGHVVQLDNGEYLTVQHFTPEFGPIATPQVITGIYQGPTEGIASWPNLAKAQEYAQGQLTGYNRITPVGLIIAHQGLVVLADTLGQPLEAAPA